MMKAIANYFDYLFFTECYLGDWSLQKNLVFQAKKGFMFKDWCLLIPINNLGILPGHPLNDRDEIIYLPKCLLIFDGVKKSLLQITEYVENPPGSNNFLPPNNQPPTVIEDSFMSDRPVTLFEIEGIYMHQLAWIDWEIESASFSLEVDFNEGDRSLSKTASIVNC